MKHKTIQHEIKTLIQDIRFLYHHFKDMIDDDLLEKDQLHTYKTYLRQYQQNLGTINALLTRYSHDDSRDRDIALLLAEQTRLNALHHSLFNEEAIINNQPGIAFVRNALQKNQEVAKTLGTATSPLRFFSAKDQQLLRQKIDMQNLKEATEPNTSTKHRQCR